MKAILTLLLFWGLASSHHAQYLRNHIADAVRAQCPACVDARNYCTPAAAQVDSLFLNDMGYNDFFDSLYGYVLDSLTAFSNLKYLEVNQNRLLGFSDLPNKIEFMQARGNLLFMFGVVPDSLRHLDLGNNRINDYPIRFPVRLQRLILDSNRLASIPDFPNIGYLTDLIELNVANNNLFRLQTLPAGLKILNVRSNYMENLPTLPPNLEILNCSKNLQLACLPLLPDSLRSLRVDSTAINCIPNLPYYLLTWSVLPVCDSSNNSNGCLAAIGVQKAANLGGFSLYPNPNKGGFWVELPNGSQTGILQVYNQIGQQVASQIINNSQQFVQIPELSAGTYYAKISNGQSSQVRAFVIQ